MALIKIVDLVKIEGRAISQKSLGMILFIGSYQFLSGKY